MNRAKRINIVLHLLLTVALLVVASLVVAQNNRARAPRRIIPTSSHASAGVRTAHIPIGKTKRLPAWVTRRHLNDKLTRMLRAWHPKGTRVAGDTTVPRQTILLTKATLTSNFSLQNAPSQDLQPFWSGDETYIYFISDRVSDSDTTERPDRVFNIYKMSNDGSQVSQVTTGTDNKLEPNVSTQSNRMCYVAGGQILNPNGISQVVQSQGFNLFILDLNGGSLPRQLTNLNSAFNFDDVRHPSFGPGGADIVFAGRLAGDTVYHIFTINVAQGNIVQYTAGPSNDYSPAWSPAVNQPQGATVIAYTSNAGTITQSIAPAQATNTLDHDDIYVFQPVPIRPFIKKITGFSIPGRNSSNRNPAWSTVRIDTRTPGVPQGQDSAGNPTGQGRILLAFASTRADNDPANPGVPNAISNGSTDIYFMDAFVGTDLIDPSVVTVRKGEGGTNNPHKLQTYNPQVAVDAIDKPGLNPNTDFDQGFQFTEDYPTWPQFINTYRMAFQSDHGGNLDIWASSILDLDAPTLLKYDESTNEIVHVERADAPGVPLNQRYVDPGTRVRIKVRAVDYQSGIKTDQNGVAYVYVQIKCPDSAQQAYDNTEHKIFYVGPGILDTNTFVLNAPYEFDAQAIKASDTSSGARFRPLGGANAPISVGGPGSIPGNFPGFNLYTPNVDDFFAYSGSNKPPDDGTIPPNPQFFPDGDNGYWLKLLDDGTNTGTFQAEWQTPVGFASDMILDVILYDNALYPFDSTGGTASNWKIYDNVWGFTTRRFNSTGQVLYVNDYDTGQKFLSSRFGTGDFQSAAVNGANLSFEGNPTESWMTEFDANLFPTIAIRGGLPFPLNNFQTPLGAHSYADSLTGTGPNGGPVTGTYDIWRIQCRGSLPLDVLNIYGPRTVVQPPDTIDGGTTPTTVLVADKCVIWHSPYPGDLFVGPGTLLDVDTQSQLTAFVGKGGRLFVNGQDIAFGLSLGQPSQQPAAGAPAPATVNDFLNNTLRVFYTNDQAINGLMDDQLLAAAGPPKGSGFNPIGFETWFNATHPDFLSMTGSEPPFKAPPVYISFTTIPQNRDYGCPNTGAEGNGNIEGSADQVFFNPPADPANGTPLGGFTTGKLFPGLYGIDATYNVGTPAIMWYKNTTSQGKVVFSPFGWETINPESFGAVTLKNRRVELMHNVLDYLRTGRLVGTIRVKNSTGSVTTPVVGALVRAQTIDPMTGKALNYTARTQSDGSFLIEGLDANGFYQLDATKSGFITQHATSNVFHGGYESRTDFFLTQAQPGSISGTITTQTGNLPVPGLTVQAQDTSDPTNPSPQIFLSLPSDASGNYIITNLPSSSYVLSITPASLAASGYTNSVPPSINVSVAPSQGVTKQDFKVTQPPGSISGIVVVADPTTGAPTSTPIPGAAITTSVTTGTPPVTTAGPTTTTGADGTYSINLDPGSYQVTASAPGFGPGTLSATVTTKKNTPNINFALKALPPGSVSGLVTTSPSSSTPVPGVTITLTTATGQVLTTTTGAVQTTTANGATYRFNYKIDNVPGGASVTVSAAKSGYTPKPNPDTQTVMINSGAEASNINFILDPLFTFNSDLTLVSSPYEFSGTSAADLFSVPGSDVNNTFSFVAWDATQQKYIYYPNSPADAFHLGRGYFLSETNTNVILALTNPNGTQAPKDLTGNYAPYSIPLQNGWNLIGMPFTTSVDFAKLQIQEASGQLVDVPTAQAGASPAIGAALFTYEHGAYEILFTLDPFRGYWLRAFRPCTLIVTSGAQQSRGVKTTRASVAANVSSDGWKLKLKAQAGEGVASNAYLGVSRKASDGFDQYKLQAPPVATKQNVQITFDHKDWGDKSAPYSMDVRSSTATSWEFTVTSNVINTPVTLSWPGITTISRHEDMQITDVDAQQTISLRNRSSYAIPASQALLTRHFRLDVKRATKNPLALTNLTVAQAGTGRGAGLPVHISYQLTRAASVQITVSKNGRRIRAVQGTGTRDAGLNEANWDLKTDGGASVAADVYTVEVRAVDQEGHIARQVQPVVVTR